MDTVSEPTAREGPVDRTTLLLGGIDLGIIVTFVVLGQLSHGIDPISQPIASIETITPFVVGWLVFAPLAGVYTDEPTSPRRIGRVTTVAWIGAANVGLILRSSPLFDGGAVWPFNLVMTGIGVLALVGWRVGYALLATTRA